jgi:hypothetical protein
VGLDKEERGTVVSFFWLLQLILSKLYFERLMVLLLQVLVANARVLGLGPKFMSVYVPKLAVYICLTSWKHLFLLFSS